MAVMLGTSADEGFSVSEFELPPPQAQRRVQAEAIKLKDKIRFLGLQALEEYCMGLTCLADKNRAGA